MKKIIPTNRPVIFESLKMTQTKHFIDGVLRMFESDICTKGFMDFSTILSISIHSEKQFELLIFGRKFGLNTPRIIDI